MSQPRTIVVTPTKSVCVALLLTFLFGPLGMLYSTVVGALVMFLANVMAFVFTAGIGLLVTWPIGMVWAAMAANESNSKLLAQSSNAGV